MVQFMALYKVALTLKIVNVTPVCDHSNIACGTVYYAVQGGSNF